MAAMRRLVTAGLLPEPAGQPVKAWVYMSLADLMVLDGSSALLEEWTARVRAQWAGHRAQASAGGSDGGAWLDSDAAGAVACDAAMVPFVTGDVNPAALDDLVRLCVQLDRLRHHPGGDDGGQDDPGSDDGGQDGAGRTGTGGTGSDGRGAPGPDTARAWEALERAIIGKTIMFLWDIYLTGVESVAAAGVRLFSMAGSPLDGPGSAGDPSPTLPVPGAASCRRAGPGSGPDHAR